ncbi:mechanosensitive ion channel family protein [Desulforhopalus singaporensis]|uniref:Small-conductance mechanosensitive channel n=1 Tax=Desulforhopalus singaporensis TaxID=91360 RepID=A0A1H0QY18_9BACT|nr:mechanosensitive ion channel family protein [Desulforhopalus singaporensis]SDP22100.1 Small-conductance mechanosensitive channel [Desulforhopalus singaporensis]
MQKILTVVLFLTLLLPPVLVLSEDNASSVDTAPAARSAKTENTTEEMLGSLLDLQKNLNEQIRISRKKLGQSNSEAEKKTLEQEIAHLDKQLSDTTKDFERIATGVEPALFTEKEPETFSWKAELANLLEPAIKELKRFTDKARKRSDLKERVSELSALTQTAAEAVKHLKTVAQTSRDKRVIKEVNSLLPEWKNVNERTRSKLDLAESELTKLQDQDTSMVEGFSDSLKEFFRARGLYLIIATVTFAAILFGCRLAYQLIVRIYFKVGKKEVKSFQVRLLYIIFQVLSIILATLGLFFVLYLAEDWFLLSVAIIFFLGLSWTIRHGLPRLWQQARLMLNIGAVRENERITLHGVPWKVESINVFCQLVNPALELKLRVPIEDLIGLVSRPFNPEEPWFPCRRGDWVVVNGGSRARVVSLSHEQVEVVERGGRRIIYPTEVFLQASPANLSRNFRLRVPFGVSYGLQEIITSTVPATMKEYLEKRMEEEGYAKSCLNLQVEFQQANSSSLDLIVLADFEGGAADICKRIERAIQKWCVDCCTQHGWEIPFPQLTVHRAD